MAVAKAGLLEAIEPLKIPVNPAALVIGAGVAGMSAAINLADQGFETWLIERETLLGGHARQVHQTWNGEPVQPILTQLIEKVESHEAIHTLTGAEITAIDGLESPCGEKKNPLGPLFPKWGRYPFHVCG